MDGLEARYFEEIIRKLKEVKASEKIEINPQFQATLRAKIMAQAHVVPTESFNLIDTVKNWKLLFTLVPSFLVLMVVATQFTQLKLLFQKNEIVPIETPVQNPPQNVQDQPNMKVVDSVPNDSRKSDVPLKTFPVKTFPGYLVMPSPETPMKKVVEPTGSSTLLTFPVENEIQIPANPVIIQIDLPKITIERFDAGEFLAPIADPASTQLPSSVRNQIVPENGVLQPVQTSVPTPAIEQAPRLIEDPQANSTATQQDAEASFKTLMAPMSQEALPAMPLHFQPLDNGAKLIIPVPVIVKEQALDLVVFSQKVTFASGIRDTQLLTSALYPEYLKQKATLTADFHFEVVQLRNNIFEAKLIEGRRLIRVYKLEKRGDNYIIFGESEVGGRT